MCWAAKGVLVVSVVSTLSASSLFTAWVAMELNMLAFLCHMKTTSQRAGPLSKYYAVQSLASAMLFSACLCVSVAHTSLSIFVLMASLAVKCGAAPFHSWFISLSEEVSKESLILMFTLQKVAPVYLLVSLGDPYWLLVLAGTSASVGVLGSITQASLKKLLGFSSVFTLGWLLVSMNSFEVIVFMLVAYSWGLSTVIYSASCLENPSESNLPAVFPPERLGSGLVGLLSLAGVPPTMGFVGKVLVLEFLILSPLGAAMALVLTLASVALLYLYLRLWFMSGANPYTQWAPKSGPESLSWASSYLMLLLGPVLLGLSLHGSIITLNFEFKDINWV